MRLLKYFLLALTCVFVSVGCQKKNDDAPEVNEGGRPGSANRDGGFAPNQVSSGQAFSGLPRQNFVQGQWGEVYVDPTESNLSLFQKSVEYLVSATMDPQLLGQVSGRSRDNTGVRFQGFVDTQANGSINLQNTSLRLVIWDDLVGKTAEDGKTINEISITFGSAASGSIQGNTIHLLFKDEVPPEQQYGEIRLDGTFQADAFRGTIGFTNYKNAVPGEQPHSANPMGNFIISTCGFLNCHQ